MVTTIKQSLERIHAMNLYNPRPTVPTFHFGPARQLLLGELTRQLGHAPSFPSWEDEKGTLHSPYDDVAEWMYDTQGKGLMLLGSCGQGKTLLARHVLPPLLHACFDRCVQCFDATDMLRCPDKVLRAQMVVVDDIGQEGEYVSFGTRRNIFCELVDAAEKQGKFLLLTSNLTASEMLRKYGERTMDRLRALTMCIVFKGESMR